MRSHPNRPLRRLALVAAVALTTLGSPLSAASTPTGGSLPATAASVVPGDEWAVESPESHGIDPAELEDARTYAFGEGKNTQGVVVVHQGAIVAEWYTPGAGPDSWAASWSMAKSFTSALIGIALEDGLIPSIDVPLVTYYPDWAGTPKEDITLRHVLHMESGLDWDEEYSPGDIASSEIITMTGFEPDQLAFAASRPAEVAPGTRFNYSSGDTMLLSGVLEQATGRSVGEYAEEVLLDPIGIDPLDWWTDAEGHTLTYCCVDTASRDFARFGLLFLLGGDWGGRQVVPADWVHDSVTDTANTYGGYGYQWWLDGGGGGIPPYFSARGHDGQYIYVIPELDLVVVRNGLYGKSSCAAIADPNLLLYYPPQGLVPGHGTTPPNSWSDDAFLGPIVRAVTAEEAVTATAAGAAASAAEAVVPEQASSHAAEECLNQPPPTSTTSTTAPLAPSDTNASSTVPTVVPVVTPARATPRFAG